MPKSQIDKQKKLNKKLEKIIERTKSQNRFLKNFLLENEEDDLEKNKTKEMDSK